MTEVAGARELSKEVLLDAYRTMRPSAPSRNGCTTSSRPANTGLRAPIRR